jgi:hypothetical protein
MKIENTSRIQVVRGHTSAEVHGDVVILHQNEAVYYGLNATGALIWKALVEPHTVLELVQILRSQFDVTEEEANRDVKRLIEELLERKMVDLLPA